MNFINGIKVVVKAGPEMVKSHREQYRFPKTKKARLQKKWRRI